jgi:phosphoglycolate phosphatase
MPFENIRAVLFDLDGTLVHTHIDFARMRQTILEHLVRHNIGPEEYQGKDVLSILTAAAGRLEDAREFLAQAEAELVSIELAACEGAYAAEGAAPTLHWLRDRGIRVGIVTRNSRQAVDRVLSQLPLPYDVLLTRADTPRVKPDPLHLHLALDRLGVPPERSVMVGDHLMDVLGGRAAKMHTLGVLTPERPPDYFKAAEPDGVIRALPELRTWISP